MEFPAEIYVRIARDSDGEFPISFIDLEEALLGEDKDSERVAVYKFWNYTTVRRSE